MRINLNKSIYPHKEVLNEYVYTWCMYFCLIDKCTVYGVIIYVCIRNPGEYHLHRAQHLPAARFYAVPHRPPIVNLLLSSHASAKITYHTQ